MSKYIPHPLTREEMRRVVQWGFEMGWLSVRPEQDPLWYSPGSMIPCDMCSGEGCFVWCRACGWDALAKRVCGYEKQEQELVDALLAQVPKEFRNENATTRTIMLAIRASFQAGLREAIKQSREATK